MNNKIKKRVKINTDEFANIETGETLTSVVSENKATLTINKDSNRFIINSDKYFIITRMAAEYMIQVLTDSEKARIDKVKMCVKTDCSMFFIRC